MKRCVNQNCRTDFLFGDSKTICPFCGRTLIENNEQSILSRLTFGNDIIDIPDIHNDIEFLRMRGHKIECHGEIIEMDHYEVFNSRFHKIINALLRGEPYQFAHQTMEYVIRVRKITDGYTGEVADFHLFGNYMGKFQVGDEIDLTAHVSGNRNIVTSAYNETTNQKITGGILIPANMVRLFYTIIVFVIATLLILLIGCVTSGAYTRIITNMLMVVGVLGVGWFWIKRKIFRRGRRR